MPVLDLKPTSDETIEKLGLKAHQLWNVKIKEEVFGPFECESLKHYASENNEVFDNALAALQNSNDWQPFYNYPQFQRRGPQVLKDVEAQEGPYWILDHGQKTGPFNRHDLDKRIEMGSIGMTGLISVDDGDTWLKLYQIPGFDRRFHSSSELPFSPLESNFQKARLELIEKIESQSSLIRTSEELAHMAHSMEVKGKVLSFRAEEVPLRPIEDTIISPNLKWQIPVAMAVMLTLVVGVRLVVTGNPEEVPEVAANEKIMPKPKQNNYVPNPSLHQQQHQPIPDRRPASYTQRSFNPPPPPPPVNQYAHESQYPTRIEAHQNDYPQEPDNYQDHGGTEQENREPAAVEHSLVGLPDESQTLDAVMGNPNPVEEASDF